MVKPRISRTVKGSTALGEETVELASHAGLELDEWQRFCIIESMRTGRDKRWSAFEFGACLPRQNGKGAIIEARLLGALYVVKSHLSIYSAHNFDTSLEHFRRVEELIADTPSLSKQLKGGSRGFKHSHGEEGIELTGNRRVRFRTRTKGGGRGFACDGVLIMDEAMFIAEMMFGALFPVLSGKTLEKPGPQIFYAGSPVDQIIHEHGVVFSRVRDRALGDTATRLAYMEWSVDDEGVGPSRLSRDVLEDRAAWAQANPALGIRISPSYIADTELGALDSRTFAVERLGVGDWPRVDHISKAIDLEAWADCEDPTSEALDPVCMVWDVSPDRYSSVSIAGRRPDGQFHIETIASKRGTGWVPGYLAERVKRHKPAFVGCDERGPGASLIDAVEKEGVQVETFDASEYARACGQFVDALEQRTVHYRPDVHLNDAVRAAQTRPLGDAWAWSRKHSSANISPLVSVTLALSAAMTVQPKKPAYAWA